MATATTSRAKARLWTRLAMVNIEPQLDKEHVSRAVNLVVVDAPTAASLALAGRAAGVEEAAEAEGGVAQLQRPGHSVCLCLSGLVGNVDLHVVPRRARRHRCTETRGPTAIEATER